MPDLLPPPANARPVLCPSCGHYIGYHVSAVVSELALDMVPGCTHGETNPMCGCRWTPNDIAWHAMYGELTPPPPARPAPLPDPVVPEGRIRRPNPDFGRPVARHREGGVPW
jgi:hypothetical protein